MKIGGTNTIDFARVSKLPKFVIDVKSRDRKRVVSLILLENNTPINLNNYTVTVAAKKSDGNDIFNDVTVVDAKNGICEVEVTEQMLALDTDLPCEIVLYGEDGTVATSSNFVIGKISSVRDENSIISSSEFTGLTKALSEVKNIDNRFKEVNSQLEHKANQTHVWNMANMGQDVKEAMTGGSVAVVGKDTVLTENIVDKQVTLEKLQYSKLIILDETVNLLNPNNVIYGKYIDAQGVMQTTTAQTVYCTDFIEVFGNEKYTFKKLLNVKGCWYDANKTFIENLAYPTAGGSTLTAPSNAKYLRWNGDETTPPNSTMIIYGSTYPSTYISYSDYKKTVELDWLRINQYNLENVILSPKIDLSNKTWYSFGDSITWQDGKKYGNGSQQGQIAKGYQALVKEKTKINYVNKGVSGDTLEGMYNQLVASDKSFDIASFFIGTNDFMFNHDLTRFTNNLNTVCTYITNNLSDKEIFFITPLQRWGYMNGETETTMTNTKGINLVEYVDKMIEICGNYGIPVIDLYRNSQINKLNINIFTRDGLHPIDVGYKKFAYLIEKQIINMLN